jgi:hypothetical protein
VRVAFDRVCSVDAPAAGARAKLMVEIVGWTGARTTLSRDIELP